jgi:hypothetical protein
MELKHLTWYSDWLQAGHTWDQGLIPSRENLAVSFPLCPECLWGLLGPEGSLLGSKTAGVYRLPLTSI